MSACSSSTCVQTYSCVDLSRHEATHTIADRQERVPGFSQGVLGNLAVNVIGAGGLGGEFVRICAKKGVGSLAIYDGDRVEPSNLNRQFFLQGDIGGNKAVCLARNAAGIGYLGTRLCGVPYFFQAAVDRGLVSQCDVVHCGVDNDDTRVFVARHYPDLPVIFTAVSEDAAHGYVAVQEPGGPCFGCFRPGAVNPKSGNHSSGGDCPGSPAVLDILCVLAGIAAYALDSIFMKRPRKWNFKQVVMHGAAPDITATIPRRVDCPICGGNGMAK